VIHTPTRCRFASRFQESKNRSCSGRTRSPNKSVGIRFLPSDWPPTHQLYREAGRFHRTRDRVDQEMARIVATLPEIARAYIKENKILVGYWPGSVQLATSSEWFPFCIAKSFCPPSMLPSLNYRLRAKKWMLGQPQAVPLQQLSTYK
jgi:hypothetical protein